MCKWYVPKVAFETIHQCLLTYGHYGYTMDLPFHQRYRRRDGPGDRRRHSANPEARDRAREGRPGRGAACRTDLMRFRSRSGASLLGATARHTRTSASSRIASDRTVLRELPACAFPDARQGPRAPRRRRSQGSPARSKYRTAARSPAASCSARIWSSGSRFARRSRDRSAVSSATFCKSASSTHSETSPMRSASSPDSGLQVIR